MKVNEIFYSIQGEGAHVGRPALFVRFSGCNLNCPFCDTEFQRYTEMSEDDIMRKLELLNFDGCDFVVLTGGEPLLQLNKTLCDLLHENGYYIAVESNGTIEKDLPIDWLTISPKHIFTPAHTKVKKCNEVKLLVDDKTNFFQLQHIQNTIEAEHYFLQPIDTANAINKAVNISKTIQLVKEHPLWRISLQTQKILNVR